MKQDTNSQTDTVVTEVKPENTWEIAGRVGYFAIGFLVAANIFIYFGIIK